MLARSLGALLLALTFAVPGFAQGISGADQQALTERIESFNAAVRANDVAGIMGAVPPAVLDEIAAQFGATREQVIAATQEQIDQLMADITLESFSMDLENADFITPPDGMTYALIPTETVIDLGEAGGKVRSANTTLGLLDGATWYLVRVDDAQQMAIVKKVYPFLAEVEFPAGTSEPVTE